ncbi:MAG: 4Fe-4S dicluster domain-containing protein [Candidatus Hodarchaeota archaeon]
MKKKFSIKINLKKCLDSSDCRLCLFNCPAGVFMQYPRPPSKNRGMTPESKPVARRSIAVWPELCTGCLKCMNICPKEAIMVH